MSYTFTTPKTDWVASDYLNTEDLQRIGDNINYLAERFYSISGTKITITLTQYEHSYNDDPITLLGLFNSIYSSLYNIMQAFYNRYECFDAFKMEAIQFILDAHGWGYNASTPTYEDMNLYEKFILACYESMEAEEMSVRRIPFTLGQYKTRL